MPDLYDDDKHDDLTPEDLCRQAFMRCSNWPSDPLGQIGLAQGLKIASDRSGISQADIVTRCRETSPFCPTDADLLRVAAEMKQERERAASEPRPARELCSHCGGTGWKPTRRGGYDTAQRCPAGCEVPARGRFNAA